MVDALDGKGTIRHLPEPGSLREQPARDMLIYRIVRGKWVALTNERMRREAEG